MKTVSLYARHSAIMKAETPLEVLMAFLADPALLALAVKYLAPYSTGYIGSAIAALLVVLLAHVGLTSLPPLVTALITGGGALVVGWGWQVIANTWLMPAPPPVTGTPT